MIEHYIRGFEEELREIRHQIHENPELGLQEFKTSALVAEKLRQWGYEVEQGLATTWRGSHVKSGRRREKYWPAGGYGCVADL